MISEEQILYEQLKAGNESAYGILYRNHYAILCHFANFYLHDRFSAESVVEDVIYHIWENRESLNITKSIRSYLVTAVKNKCLDTLKLKRNQNEKPISSLSDKAGYYMDSQTAGDSPYGTLLSKELEEKVIQAIEELPVECRQVFIKSRMENKKNKEIADELGISVNTVKYHLKNALKILREKLEHYLIALSLFLLMN